MSEPDPATVVCKQCGQPVKVLLFMGLQPDGFVCDHCHLYYSEDMKIIGTIIGG